MPLESPRHTSRDCHPLRRVVVVDDDKTQQALLASLLRIEGFEVVSFDSAVQALTKLDHAAPPALIVTDLHMPGMDGWRFCRLLKSPEYEAFNHVPILVVSAIFMGEEVSELTIGVGANAFLPAPLNARRFKDTIRRIMAGKLPCHETTVLVVDDDLHIAQVIARVFSENGYHAVIAHTKCDALEKALALRPDLAVVDHHLPDGEGYDLIADLLRHNPNTAVIIMTGDQDSDIAAKCIEKGARAYLSKPFDNTYLLALAHKACRENALMRIETVLERRTSELRKSEERRGRSEELFRTMAEFTYDWEYWVRPDGSYVYISPSCERLTGHRAEEFYADPTLIERLTHPDEKANVSAHQRECCGESLESTTAEMDFRIVTAKGETRWISHACRPIYGAGGEHLGRRVSNRDITDRKLAEESLEKAMVAASAATRAKSVFLANMSHEIRTPMNGILGLTELLFQTSLTERQHKYLSGVSSSAAALLSIINDILDLSKIEAGKLVLESTVFSLDMHLVSLLRGLAVRAYEKRVELLLFVTPCVPDELKGDPGRLGQILNNLVGNAIKFTEKGEVSIKVETDAFLNGDVVLHFSVQDSGVGIPRESHHLLFEEFTQVDSSVKRKFGGTGLGLAITKRLVGMMGGRVWFESEPGKGSVFHFTARFPVCSAAAPEQSQSRAFDGVHLLVADDNEYSRELFRTVLEKWNAFPTTVGSGREALAELRRAAAAGSAYPLLLLDLLMPDMNGIEVIEQLRREPAISATRLLVISQSQEPAAFEKLKGLGVDVFPKPFSQSELRATLQNLLRDSSALSVSRLGRGGKPDRVEPISAGTWTGNPLRILLAEDNPINQLVVTGMLTPDHHVTVANNGREAVEAFKAGVFDVVLMDVSMPEMDGCAATRAIREYELDRGTPPRVAIIALTAHAMSEDSDRCLKSGMDAYLIKPIRQDELLAAFGQFCLNLGSPPLPISPARSLFDPERIFADMGRNKLLTQNIIAASVEYLPLMLEAVRADIKGGDLGRILLSTHNLKGSLAVFNHEMTEKARQIEATIKTRTTVGVDTIFCELSEMTRRLVDEMKDYMACDDHAEDAVTLLI